MKDLPAINKAEFRRFVQSRYAGARRNGQTGHYRLGASEYDADMLWVEAQCEKAYWLEGIAEKPDWIRR